MKTLPGLWIFCKPTGNLTHCWYECNPDQRNSDPAIFQKQASLEAGEPAEEGEPTGSQS